MPTTEPPIPSDDPTREARAPGLDPAAVCTLSDDGLAERLAWIRREILPHAVERHALADGLAVELAAAPGLEERLDHWIGLERACCAPLRFERTASATPGRLRLEIRGIDSEASVFRSLGAAPAEAPGAPGRARLAKAAGAGFLASLVVCCLLPFAAVALLGAVAAPLARLDAPLPIAAGALLGGVAVWWWLGRGPRGAAPGGAGCGPGC